MGYDIEIVYTNSIGETKYLLDLKFLANHDSFTDYFNPVNFNGKIIDLVLDSINTAISRLWKEGIRPLDLNYSPSAIYEETKASFLAVLITFRNQLEDIDYTDIEYEHVSWQIV